MKSIKIDRILEAVAPRVYRAEYRVTHHGQPFMMPSFSDLAKLVERLKAEGSYDADNNLALFGVPNVFSPLGDIPAYNYIVWDGRLEFVENEQDAPPVGKYLWLMWGFHHLDKAIEYIRGRAFTTLFVLDDGVYVEVLPQFAIKEDNTEKRVSPSLAYYTLDGEDRPAADRRVCIPYLCEVQLKGKTYCFLAQATDDIYEHLSCGPLCSMGQPTGVISEKGTATYEGKNYYFDLKWENGHGVVELKDEEGLLYDPDMCGFVEEK